MSRQHSGKLFTLTVAFGLNYFPNKIQDAASVVGTWKPIINSQKELHRKQYAEKAMPFLRLETATPSETEKQIEELRKANVMLKEFERSREDMEKLLQRALPLIEQLEKARKEGKAQNMKDVKAIIDEKLEPFKGLWAKIDPEEGYHGEGDPTADWSFGTEGWPLTEKFLEYGSRVTLLMREVGMDRKSISAGRLDSQFNIGKLVHCFLNQAGLSTIGEAEFHIDRFIERSLMVRGYYDALERLKKVEEQVRQLSAQKAVT